MRPRDWFHGRMTNLCSEGCGGIATRRGMCQNCYRRWKRNGTAQRRLPKPPISVDVVMAHVRQTDSGCLLWIGLADKDNRPIYYDGDRYRAGLSPMVYVQRWMYEKHVVPLEPDQTVTRACGIKLCVNHAHAQLWRNFGSRAFVAKERSGVGAPRTQCVNGHPLDEDNLYVNPRTGHASCRQCAWESKVRSRGGDPATATRNPHNRNKSHCFKGHPLEGANIWLNAQGNRICRTCRADGIFKSNLRRYYGITFEIYMAMLESQSYKCLLCDKGFELGDTKSVNVDHCHDTGVVRGLLCRRCNLGLGHFGDRIDALERAIEYLRRSRPDGQ